ncbi:MAG: UDP-N-acetylmuramate--L-alanine ligase [Lachnospiraceae bacterium]|nr:UDP-N-acetylmuramate--L-alanine ligase [Lachnospiraceae bacterium]
MYETDLSKPVRVHFIGIGGISMSGLARILLNRGFKVSGSDAVPSELTEELSSAGAEIHIGQSAGNITADIELVVYSAAIKPGNPEYDETVRRGIPMITRATLLGQIMKAYELPLAVAGTHGKTTTTSMISEILLAAGSDPTLSIGGILPSIGSNLRIGHSGFFVTEACEYTNSFLEFFPKAEVILNIEEDHLDFFKDINDIRASFRRFAELVPEDGTIIINKTIDDLENFTAGLKCRIVTFGPDSTADYYCSDIGYDEKGRTSYILHHGDETVPVSLSLVGEHNVYDSLAAFAAGELFGMSREHILSGLSSFGGTERRFELKGKLGTGDPITIIDDYAHHPTEIKATLSAAAHYPHKKLYLIFQPHTYTRTKAFMNEFAEALSSADCVILADIYAARETDSLGISSGDLQKLVAAKGCEAHYFRYFGDIVDFILLNAQPGDLVLTMGAGDIYRVGDMLLGR